MSLTGYTLRARMACRVNGGVFKGTTWREPAARHNGVGLPSRTSSSGEEVECNADGLG